jgi:hypothetical protein
MRFSTPTRECSTGVGGVCPPGHSKRFPSLEAIVQDYIDRRRDRAECELGYFGGQKNLPNAIRVAALAINCRGKRHPHQRRIPGLLLEHYRRGLMRKRKSMESCKNFHELMAISQSVADKIWKHSELTVYDTAHRVGSYLRRRPDRVYMHAGTRASAKALGLRPTLPYLFPSELPSAFQRLKPYEIEDCLCIYKGALESLMHKRRHRLNL